MEDKVKCYKSPAPDFTFIECKEVPHLSMTDEEQSTVSNENNALEDTQNSNIDLKKKGDRSDMWIKTEREADGDSGQPMVEETYFKREEVYIKSEVLSSDSTMPEPVFIECKHGISEDYPTLTNRTSTSPDITCNPTPAAEIWCNTCGKVNFMSSEQFIQFNNTKNCESYKCEACRQISPKRFKCSMCSYQTNDHGNFKRHGLVHIDDSEVNSSKRFKCKACPYKTNDRSNLKRHDLVHKDSSEVEMHKCTSCEYKTKYKSYLTCHMIKHQDPLDVQKFYCEFCSYQTKLKGNLKSHLLSHKDPSEIEMFKCEMCEYSTKYKHHLGGHVLSHKQSLEVEMFNCEMCEYSTKHKRALINHFIVHKGPSEVEMFRCETCDFSTKYKHRLKTHMLIHKDPSEIEMLKCGVCEFSTKYKRSLKRHALNHKH